MGTAGLDSEIRVTHSYKQPYQVLMDVAAALDSHQQLKPFYCVGLWRGLRARPSARGPVCTRGYARGG